MAITMSRGRLTHRRRAAFAGLAIEQEEIMKRLAAVAVVMAVILWAATAFAIDDVPYQYGPAIGGGVWIDDDAGETVPTASLSGVYYPLAYQAFYGFGDTYDVYGASLDYVFEHNFDECFTCPEEIGEWWIGIGPTFINTEVTVGGVTVDNSDFGANLGFGYMDQGWSLNMYGHYVDESFMFQATVAYSF